MKKKWIWIGVAILSIVVVSTCVIIFSNKSGNNSKNPDNIVKQYGDILMKGNYGDIIDIAYYPESVLITEEKIQEKKNQYFEEMRKNNSNVISFDYVKSTEDNEKISYKLTINGTETKHIDVKKPENKIIIEDLYLDLELKTWKDSTVSCDGITIPKETTTEDNQQFDTYKIITLSGIDYGKIKITNDFYDDYPTSVNALKMHNEQRPDDIEGYSCCDFKDEIKEQIFKTIESSGKYGTYDENFGVWTVSHVYPCFSFDLPDPDLENKGWYGYFGNGVVKVGINLYKSYNPRRFTNFDEVYRITLKQNQDGTFTITDEERDTEYEEWYHTH